jgi:hypothetical protein
MITTTTTPYICKTIDSRYKMRINKSSNRTKGQTMWQENTNKTINTNKHIQAMIRITDVINTGVQLVLWKGNLLILVSRVSIYKSRVKTPYHLDILYPLVAWNYQAPSLFNFLFKYLFSMIFLDYFISFF